MNAKLPLYSTLIQVISVHEMEQGCSPSVIILPEGSLAILERELMNTSITMSTSPASGKPCATFMGILIYEEQQVIKLVYDF